MLPTEGMIAHALFTYTSTIDYIIRKLKYAQAMNQFLFSHVTVVSRNVNFKSDVKRGVFVNAVFNQVALSQVHEYFEVRHKQIPIADTGLLLQGHDASINLVVYYDYIFAGLLSI